MGLDARDEYGLVQGGFRIDSDLAPGELLTFQGDLYTGRFGQYTADDAEVSGGNFLGRWSRELGTDSSVMLQAYYDRTHRLLPGVGEEDRNSIDIEWQHRFPLARIHDIIWGLNARLSEDKIDNLGPSLAFLPDQETSYLLSGYVQDEIRVIPDLLSVTLGSKFEYNSFSGFEVQPSGRFAFTPTKTQTIWGAVSRAVRTPSRIDQDLFVPNPAFFPASILRSSRAFDSEELIAYELGYRAQPASNLKFDLALFYHDYDNLRSQEPIGAAPFPVVFANNLEGQSYGAELEVGWQPASWWRMSLGYTLMQTHFRAVDGSRDTTGGRGHGNDPNHIVVARSSFDLPGDFELDTIFRYVDRLPAPQTPAYTTVDVRLAWVARDDLELALVGRNLLDDTHPEWRSGVTREIGRSLYFTVTWRF